ncbi:hypothetical protein [Pseudomonas sp. S1(2024)]|uniref:hypothetical protein n=1 Tax=Pseudomonas sp. S1(2024) TaxID=3390191 RepID=UPI00397A5955
MFHGAKNKKRTVLADCKGLLLFALANAAAFPAFANSDTTGNIIRISAPIVQSAAVGETWKDIAPLVSAWQNKGSEYDCSQWSPSPDTVALGETFNQSQNCKQDQERTVQQREQNETTLVIRDVGAPTTERQVLWQEHSQEAVGTMKPDGSAAWEQFAIDRGLPTTWNNLGWISKNLSVLPSEPYPLSNIEALTLNSNPLTSLGGIDSIVSISDKLVLSSVPLTNLDGLRSLTSVGNFTFTSNTLINIDGLSNLTTATGSFIIQSNQLPNVNGLSNLTYVGGNLSFHGNAKLNNLDGIRNIKVGGKIMIYKNYAGPKLAASTPFCQNNTASQFDAVSYAGKSVICAQ